MHIFVLGRHLAFVTVESWGEELFAERGGGQAFRAQKRNKHFDSAPGSKFEKNGGIFVDRPNKEGYELCMLSKYSGKRQHFNL